jgi:Ca2+-binding EF-hand superfamily protein
MDGNFYFKEDLLKLSGKPNDSQIKVNQQMFVKSNAKLNEIKKKLFEYMKKY